MRVFISQGGCWVEMSDDLREKDAAEFTRGATAVPEPSARQQEETGGNPLEECGV